MYQCYSFTTLASVIAIIISIFSAIFTYRTQVIASTKRQDDLFLLRYEFYKTLEETLVTIGTFERSLIAEEGFTDEQRQIREDYEKTASSLVQKSKWLFDDELAIHIKEELSNEDRDGIWNGIETGTANLINKYSYNKGFDQNTEINKCFDKYLKIK